MKILEIEKLFDSEETIGEVLERCKNSFDRTDYYIGIMQNNITENPEEAKKALNELTGIYMDLKTVIAVAETQKKNREIRRYNEIRIETESGDKKFVSASAEKEASSYVAPYRRVRNILQGYCDACEKAISTLQSVLKYSMEWRKLTGGKGEE